MCPTCGDTGKVLTLWDRPGGPPGNGYVGCPDCPNGAAYAAAVKAETDAALSKFSSNMDQVYANAGLSPVQLVETQRRKLKDVLYSARRDLVALQVEHGQDLKGETAAKLREIEDRMTKALS